MTATTYQTNTSHCRISVTDTGGNGPVVLLIHGNSSCKEVFTRQFESDLTRRFRFVAFDLPGHGASADAIDPQLTYSMPGYADVAVELLHSLGITRLAVFGWSLGGHIGIELSTRPVDVVGLLLTGTPPIGHNAADFAAGFLPSEHMELTGKENFSATDITSYARETTGAPAPFIEAAVRRTDGRARRLMLAAVSAGRGVDQREVVANSSVPIAVVTGADEPFINNDYLAQFPYRNLWEARVHVINNTGHAPFWERPEQFNVLFSRFLNDVLAP